MNVRSPARVLPTRLVSAMTIKTFTFNPFQTNCYVCHDEARAVIVDPSSAAPGEHQAVLDYLEKHHLKTERILLTHAHIDHIFGCRFLSEALCVGVEVHRDEAQLLKGAEEQAALFGTTIEAPPAPSSLIEPGTALSVPGGTWRVLHTPGHSPGSVSFFDETNGFVISGDVLFAGSIGRTDLWRASLPELMRSIHQELAPLGETVRVLPGHGPPTTIGRELACNPFLTGL